MAGLLVALVGAYGVYLVYSAYAFGWTGLAPGRPPTGQPPRRRTSIESWLVQAGLDGVKPSEFASVMALLFLIGGALAYGLFGGVLPALVCGAFASTFPPAAYRTQRERRRRQARDAWPRLIEEIRLLTGGAGRSIPQAVLEVGRRSPPELQRHLQPPGGNGSSPPTSGAPRRCSRGGWPIPQPMPFARPCSSPMRWGAQTSIVASPPWSRTASRTSRGGRTRWPSKRASASPGASSLSSRWEWPLLGSR